MLSIIQDIPNVNTYPLTYVFERMKLKHKPIIFQNLQMTKYMGLTVSKDYLKNGVTVLIKVRSIEVEIYQKLTIMLN
jgi:hypothetical protein